MINHGVSGVEKKTEVSSPVVAETSIPFVIGVAPVQMASTSVAPGKPIKIHSWDEAVEKLGFSEDWENYTLCEFMYSHFKLYRMAPVIFCNMLDVATMHEEVAAKDIAVTDKKIKLPIEALDTEQLVIKAKGGAGEAHTKGTDYGTYYSGENLVIELIESGSIHSVSELNVAYRKVKPDLVTDTVIATGLSNIDKCMTTVGLIPDLIVAPKFSTVESVAAVMAQKAEGINGVFKAKAIVDISAKSDTGAKTVTEALARKLTDHMTDMNHIVGWPMMEYSNRKYHKSSHIAGLMAQVDNKNEGSPYESPSNKEVKCDKLILSDGTEVDVTLEEANTLNGAGIVTSLNFLGEWKLWGNYTACFPTNTDPKDHFISISRMFDWENNTLVKTLWKKLDGPNNPILVDSILNAENVRLNGLTGKGHLLGGRIEYLASENPLADIMKGKLKVHIYMTPPGPAQEINHVLEYAPEYVQAAFGG